VAYPFFTIGHSTRAIAEFVGLLQVAGVRFLVDVRTVPRSRTNPQYNKDVLPGSLAECQIGYEHIAELGGLRAKQPQSADSPNTFWENESFRNYADYALTPTFRAGLEQLREIGAHQPTAIMCAEAVWWRCHRRIIADYLLWSGESVFHILSAENTRPAIMTPAARPTPEGLTYPAATEQLPLNLPLRAGDD
jgi:uncharacterized protein (DUF488 family)